MKKFLSVLLALSLFLSLFFTSANFASAEIVEEIEIYGEFEADSPNENARLSLPNAINVTTSTSGDYVEVYASNLGVDTVDLVTATFEVQRYNHYGQWIHVRTQTMEIKNLKPGKHLMKGFSNPQNYGYENLILSFVAKDGSSVTANSGEITRTKNPYNWRDITTLAKHTYDHAGEFGLTYNEMTYSQQANTFYKNRNNTGYEHFTDPAGNIKVYQFSTKTFGSYDSSGKTRTYFKPSRGDAYWEDEKKKLN